jgi:Type II intron maturase
MQGEKPIHRTELLNDDDHTIVITYQSEYRGYVQYYQLAENIAWLNKLQWTMRTSLLKTLAHKHQMSVSKIIRRYRNKVETEHGLLQCIKVVQPRDGKKPLVAIFGGISLRRKKSAVLTDQTTYRYISSRVELVKRLLAQECEICRSTDNIEVHHIRGLADLKRKGQKEKPYWAQVMSARRRKTLVLCQDCHADLHQGRLDGKPDTG